MLDKVFLIVDKGSSTSGHGMSSSYVNLGHNGWEPELETLYPAFATRELAVKYMEDNDILCREIIELPLLRSNIYYVAVKGTYDIKTKIFKEESLRGMSKNIEDFTIMLHNTHVYDDVESIWFNKDIKKLDDECRIRKATEYEIKYNRIEDK